MELGTLIHTRREVLEISSSQLGDMVGLSGPTITRIELGEIQCPRAKFVIPLARALRVHPMDILNACTKDKERWNENE